MTCEPLLSPCAEISIVDMTSDTVNGNRRIRCLLDSELFEFFFLC